MGTANSVEGKKGALILFLHILHICIHTNKFIQSEVTSVNFIKMVVAVLGVFIRGHFVRRTLEAHTDVAARASDSVTSIDFDYRHSASWVGAEPSSVLEHVLFEILISLPDFHDILTFDAGMDGFLNRLKFTLQRLQYYILQVSQM